MKLFIHTFLTAVLASQFAFTASRAQADSVPEILHYKFSGTGTNVPNLASAPPSGTTTATINGGLTQTGTDLNFGGGGFSLVGSGVSSTTDYLNTGWAPNLGTGSWTISFISSNITSSSTLFYIFGDPGTASFRCFTNGVAGANNWILRGGGLTDVLLTGGATVVTHRNTFVYDNTLNNVKAYLDGVLINTVAQTTPNLTGIGPFKVVGYGSNVGAPAGGLLDDFRIYSRALSAGEVLDIDKKSIMTVTGNAVDIADGDSTPDTADHTDFGNVTLTGATLVRTFTIANSGNLDLTLGSVTVGGTHAADFAVTLQPATPVSAGGSTTFQVTFNPSAAGLRSATVSFSNNDADKNPFDFSIQGTGAAVTVTPTSGLVTTEAGGTDMFTVVLTAPPTAEVTIALSSSDTTEGTVSPASLTFTSADWSVAQPVTVTGVSDGIVDGNVAYSINTDASSMDTVYDGSAVDDVSVTNTDDGVPVELQSFEVE